MTTDDEERKNEALAYFGLPPDTLDTSIASPSMRGADRYIRVEAKTVYLIGPIKEGVTVEAALSEAREALTFASNRDDTYAVRHLEITAPEDASAYTEADAWGEPFGTEY